MDGDQWRRYVNHPSDIISSCPILFNIKAIYLYYHKIYSVFRHSNRKKDILEETLRRKISRRRRSWRRRRRRRRSCRFFAIMLNSVWRCFSLLKITRLLILLPGADKSLQSCISILIFSRFRFWTVASATNEVSTRSHGSILDGAQIQTRKTTGLDRFYNSLRLQMVVI